MWSASLSPLLGLWAKLTANCDGLRQYQVRGRGRVGEGVGVGVAVGVGGAVGAGGGVRVGGGVGVWVAAADLALPWYQVPRPRADAPPVEAFVAMEVGKAKALLRTVRGRGRGRG